MATLEAIAKAVAEACGYAYVGPVGAGVFKETFEVREGSIRHAVKVFRAGGDVERIAREVKATLLCNHPNIAKLRRVDVIDVPGADQCLICRRGIPQRWHAGRSRHEGVTDAR